MKQIIFVLIILLVVFFLVREKGSGPHVSQNGISTSQLVDEILTKYDVNADEKLSVSEESFKRTTSNNVEKVESRGLLFTDADAKGNQDGFVSKTELSNFLDEFDTDRDGEITTYLNIFKSIFGSESEWWKLEKRYGEKFKYEQIKTP